MSKKVLKKIGFTIIELLVVISIIGLIASIVLSSVSSAKQKAQYALIQEQLEHIQTSLMVFHSLHGYFPACYAYDPGPQVCCIGTNTCKYEGMTVTGDINDYNVASAELKQYANVAAITPVITSTLPEINGNQGFVYYCNSTIEVDGRTYCAEDPANPPTITYPASSGIVSKTAGYNVLASTVLASGCTDSSAFNYDSNAVVDNGTCTGCNDTNYIEYWDGSGSVCSTEKIDGCTDSNYANYNSSATYNDGSCYGCGNSYYLEYWDGGSYCSTIAVLGCPDSSATNYNDQVNYNDGSCQYIPPGSCQGTPSCSGSDQNTCTDNGNKSYCSYNYTGTTCNNEGRCTNYSYSNCPTWNGCSQSSTCSSYDEWGNCWSYNEECTGESTWCDSYSDVYVCEANTSCSSFNYGTCGSISGCSWY